MSAGVVVSYFEWVQDLQSFFWSETEIVDKLFRILETAFSQVLGVCRKRQISMRLAALSLGVKRVHDAKRIRGLFHEPRTDRIMARQNHEDRKPREIQFAPLG